MIAAWMLFAVAIVFAFGFAAAMLERLLRAWHRPARVAWGAALFFGLVLPPSVLLVPRSPSAAVPVRPLGSGGAATARSTTLATIVVRAGAASRWASSRRALTVLDTPLGIVWALASGLLAVSLVASGVRLARARRAWARRDVAGTSVLVTNDVGPAVIGVRRMSIVLPEWTLALDAPLLTLVVRHEREHVLARDPMLLALGVLAAVAMPWNPATWWALRRLRLATELDCDARVLATHADPSRYGLLLLAVAQRRASAGWQLSGAPALVESSSDLSRRIAAMRSTRPRRRLLTSVAAVAAASLGIVGAVAACAASRDVVGPKSMAGSPPDVLKLPVRTVTVDSATYAATKAAAPSDSVPAMVASNDGTLRVGKVSAKDAAGARREFEHHGTITGVKKPTMPPAGYDGPYFEFQVEHPVVQAPNSPGPRYPDSLKVARVEGAVMAQFVVDTLGLPEPGSFKVLKSDHDLFTRSVAAALPNMRFIPARVGGRVVKQLVQQPFQFSLGK